MFTGEFVKAYKFLFLNAFIVLKVTVYFEPYFVFKQRSLKLNKLNTRNLNLLQYSTLRSLKYLTFNFVIVVDI